MHGFFNSVSSLAIFHVRKRREIRRDDGDAVDDGQSSNSKLEVLQFQQCIEFANAERLVDFASTTTGTSTRQLLDSDTFRYYKTSFSLCKDVVPRATDERSILGALSQ